jgi:RNA polymerase sigma-70 factor (ECF subfamily)
MEMEPQLREKSQMPAVADPASLLLAEKDDRTLVSAAQHGHSEAFEILVHRHQHRILRSALRWTRNRADAEDIVQQSLQKAFVHLGQFQGHSSFCTWLTRIAINEALMWQRKKSSAAEVSIEPAIETNGITVALDFPSSGPSPEDSCFRSELKQILSAALNKLTPRARKAIELRELEELSTEEAARLLGVSVSAMKGRVFHGRKKLQEVLESWRPRTVAVSDVVSQR